jgi:hypothetical protein
VTSGCTSAITPVHPILAKKMFKNKRIEKRPQKIPFMNFENPLYFWHIFKSIFTYQNGLESKKLFGELFLKLNFTCKYI